MITISGGARQPKLGRNVTSTTMEAMSKDNFFFGIRAVDRDGHRSPVSFPLPQR